ncbi:MAG: hypothetical protein AAF583_10585 [Pseudomonadota bacterium]
MSGDIASQPDTEQLDLHRMIAVTSSGSPLQAEITELKERLSGKFGGFGATDFHDLHLDKLYTDDIFNGRTDKEARAQYTSFVRHLANAQLAIIDLNYNPVAYYVLGVRHSVSNGITLALTKNSQDAAFANSRFGHEGDHPFKYLDVTHPDWLDSALLMAKGLGNPQAERWTNDIRNTGTFDVRTTERQYTDRELKARPRWQYSDEDGNHLTPKIEIWRGDIKRAKNFDVWVNSENTHMEMARFWDKSVSANIRKLGSVRQLPLSANRRKDALGLALAEKIGTRKEVKIGSVFITPTDPASDLSADNNVVCVAHLAAVEPNEESHGFRSGGEIHTCVETVLKEVAKLQPDESKNRGERNKIKVRSILFPLIGSGDGGAHPSLVAHQMVYCLSEVLKGGKSEFGLEHLEKIGIIAYAPSHFDYLSRELHNLNFEKENSADPTKE